jgi:type II secretory pathway pseudopilin PulG
MCQPCQVLEEKLLNPRIGQAQGFILLEVLVAMSLILGSWMALVGTYQNLTLRTTQTESKRAQLRGELDAFEMGEQVRVNISTNIKGQSNESTRMSSRNRAKHVTAQPALKNER